MSDLFVRSVVMPAFLRKTIVSHAYSVIFTDWSKTQSIKEKKEKEENIQSGKL